MQDQSDDLMGRVAKLVDVVSSRDDETSKLLTEQLKGLSDRLAYDASLKQDRLPSSQSLKGESSDVPVQPQESRRVEQSKDIIVFGSPDQKPRPLKEAQEVKTAVFKEVPAQSRKRQVTKNKTPKVDRFLDDPNATKISIKAKDKRFAVIKEQLTQQVADQAPQQSALDEGQAALLRGADEVGKEYVENIDPANPWSSVGRPELPDGDDPDAVKKIVADVTGDVGTEDVIEQQRRILPPEPPVARINEDKKATAKNVISEDVAAKDNTPRTRSASNSRKPQQAAIRALPRRLAYEALAAPLRIKDDLLVCLVPDDYESDRIQNLSEELGRGVQVIEASHEAVLEALQQAYGTVTGPDQDALLLAISANPNKSGLLSRLTRWVSAKS